RDPRAGRQLAIAGEDLPGERDARRLAAAREQAFAEINQAFRPRGRVVTALDQGPAPFRDGLQQLAEERGVHLKPHSAPVGPYRTSSPKIGRAPSIATWMAHRARIAHMLARMVRLRKCRSRAGMDKIASARHTPQSPCGRWPRAASKESFHVWPVDRLS